MGAQPEMLPSDLADALAADDLFGWPAALLCPLGPPHAGNPSGSRAWRQLLQLARERWGMLSAGLLVGPGLAAGMAVWAAAAALVGAHLLAALDSQGTLSSRQ
ncbi:hypothetical protein ABPG77_001120 [Micractinium sp. CCAP 211/92]